MENISKLLTVVFFATLITTGSAAQIKFLPSPNSPISYTDSLMLEFRNTVYGAFYNRSYVMTQTPSHTILKVDIDNESRIVAIEFSDSADSSLARTWNSRTKKHDDKATLEKYAKAKAYKNLSLLLPLSFEPNAGNREKLRFSYQQVDATFKFDGQNFSGIAVILPGIFILPGRKEF